MYKKLNNSSKHLLPHKLVAALVMAGLVSPSIAATKINFPNSPLGVSASLNPNVLMSLSVEFPTVGAAYNADPTFIPSTDYVGYWRSDRCYSYNTTAQYFEEAAVASGTNKTCSGNWSGNFLNWSTTSAIDVLRKTMSGGYRSTDTKDLTVLERARLNPLWSKAIGNATPPSLYTPFNSSTLTINNNTTTTFIAQHSGGTTKPMFPRVKVCDTRLGDPELTCVKYGNSLKPTGEIQKRADVMRFGAFGYLLDNAVERDGGVLRASLRSVGPTYTDATGVSGANPQAEWRSADGTLIVNPDKATEGNSGVINYLNKFGLANGYKTYDPVSELYSESLRYLMGTKKPLSSSTGNITSAFKDGFPVATSWDDPIQGACQKNYIILIGDTNTHCDGNVPGGKELGGRCGSAGAAIEKGLDAKTWTNYIGSLEERGNNLSGTGTGVSDATYFIAGLAYYAHVNNIRPDKKDYDIRVKSFMIDVDEASGNPHSNRQYWYAAKYGGFDDLKPSNAPVNYRAVPDKGEWEVPAVIPGYTVQPKTYFLASNGKVLQQSLQAAFATIAAEGAANAKLAASASRITASGSGTFSTTMDTTSWTGNLVRKEVSVQNGQVTVSATPSWNAAALLNEMESSNRNIVTYDPDAKQGVNFNWSSIPLSLKDLFLLPYAGQTGKQKESEGQRRLEWVRGVRTEETVPVNSLRLRSSILADAGNSNPTYVSEPGGDGYADLDYVTWASKNKSRQKVVYLGTSSGMLHAFAADSGKEVFSYIPSRLWKKVAASPAVLYERKPMVDAQPLAIDVPYGKSWATLLVGSLGAGGKGVYALDVTHPESFASSNVLWEFSEKDDTDVGHIMTQPTVAQLSDGRAVILFGSGYNNTSAVAPAEAVSSTGSGYLYVLLADKGGEQSWVKEKNYAKIQLGTSGSVTQPSGVSNPTVSGDASGYAHRVYLGDLDGGLWRVDVPTKNNSGSVSMNGWPSSAKKVFSAEINGTPQPITIAPSVVFHPQDGVMVLFGTGKWMEKTDRDSLPVANSFYGVWDGVADAAPNLSRSDLQPNILTSNASIRLVTVPKTGLKKDPKGWYIDLKTADSNLGERVIYPANVDLGTVDFTTQLGMNSCSNGTGYFMSLSPITGEMTTPSFDANGDNKIDSSDAVAGIATKTPPGQTISIPLGREADPYAPVSYIRYLGAEVVGAAGGSGGFGLPSKVKSKFGRLNYRQITEIKR